MRFRRLAVENWGVFRGRHEFNLETVVDKNGSRRNLIIFRGHNGAGKSTVFQCFTLALYGRLALGDRVALPTYNSFLMGRLHRGNGGGEEIQANMASTELCLDYMRSGEGMSIDIQRKWTFNNQKVVENLRVFEDGQVPTVPPEYYQNYLQEMLPPGLCQVCFLDAEWLDSVSNPLRHDGALRDTIERLFGVDLVRRLRVDLEHYVLRHGGGNQREKAREEVLQRQAMINDLDTQLAEENEKAVTLAAQETDLRSNLEEQEQRLLSEGGAYAERRPLLQRRLERLQEEIEIVSEQIRELCNGLLPFTLAPGLVSRLSERLQQEMSAYRRTVAHDLWIERLRAAKVTLEDDDIWGGVEIHPEMRHLLTNRILEVLGVEENLASEPFSYVHSLSDTDRDRVQDWINQILHKIPEQIRTHAMRLQELQNERHDTEMDLNRAPEDVTLAPFHAEITRLEKAVSDVRREQLRISERVGALQYQRNEQIKCLRNAVKHLETIQSKKKRLELARRSTMALNTYEETLVRSRLGQLEEALLVNFNTLCRKERLLGAVYINPETFEVLTEDASEAKVTLGDFSAGERQLYSLALLWALRQITGYQLPLAVDSPLARLDELHRLALIQDYVPRVSDQVLLFATDSELDTTLITKAQPYVARVYQLTHDETQGAVMVTCDESVTL